MRGVIETFPTSPEVNEAYYYIGLGHFQLAHYSRAIVALERVGTTLTSNSAEGNKLEAGKRFFIKVEDADLAVLDPAQSVAIQCVSSGGDSETIECFSVGRNVRLVLGSIASRLGVPRPENGVLEIKGGDTVTVTYIDEHTADKTLNRPSLPKRLWWATESLRSLTVRSKKHSMAWCWGKPSTFGSVILTSIHRTAPTACPQPLKFIVSKQTRKSKTK